VGAAGFKRYSSSGAGQNGLGNRPVVTLWVIRADAKDFPAKFSRSPQMPSPEFKPASKKENKNLTITRLSVVLNYNTDI
jgi:hypothetical protein